MPDLAHRTAGGGRKDRAEVPRNVSRPPAVEREATHRAITLAEIAETPILIVHVSGREAAEEIRRAKARGLNIRAETCPQYLFLTADDLDMPDFEGAKCMCSPPPRDKKSQAALWQGLQDGLFDILSSDHAPYRFDDQGKKLHGMRAPFRKVANGLPGLETRAPLLFSEGVVDGADRAGALRRAELHQCGAHLWPLSAQGHDRGRLRCRHRDLGSGEAR